MRVQPLVPDTGAVALPEAPGTEAFGKALDAVAGVLDEANLAEDDFARGGGSLQAAMYERARADVALSAATAAAQRIVASLQAVLNMQI